MDSSQLTRRTFLYGSALVAGAAALSACSPGGGGQGPGGNDPTGGPGSDAVGSFTEPLPKPAAFKQSPTLDGGSLPAIEERLPENPYVVPHKWIQPGKYGGTLNMQVFTTTGAIKADSDRNFFYGHSPLRWLNDGKDVGPGLVESWESNADASEWTFRFRKGLKWSDGEPFTVDDILFWWNEFILEQKMAQTPPDEARSGKGTLAEFKKVDDSTLTMTFDAPAPLTADRMAMWVNGNIGKNGPIWIMPSHYLKQFHPKYGKNVPDNWDTVGGLMESKADWHRNPDCPTMLGFKCKSFDNAKGAVLERNPYYWAVMPNGDQLPYIDEIQINVVTDPESGKLQVQQGSVDFCNGNYNQITLNDVQGIRDTAERSNTEIILWDSGSGTGSIFFLNYDYFDKDLRELIRQPKFRQAISHAFNRDAVRKSVYFNTGEPTTGTLSPKAIEYSIDETGKKAYTDWRDAYVAYDPEKAKSLLEEIGVKDSDGDGMRELPERQEALAPAGHHGRLLAGAPDQGQPAGVGPQGHRGRDEDQPDRAADVRRPVEDRQADGAQQLGGRRRAEPPGLPAVAGADRVHPLGAAGRPVVPAVGHQDRRHRARQGSVGADAAADGAGGRRPDQEALGSVRPEQGRAGRDEALPAGLGHDQDPHLRRPVHDRFGGQLPAGHDRQEGSPERTQAGEPRPGRRRQPLDPPDSGRL